MSSSVGAIRALPYSTLCFGSKFNCSHCPMKCSDLSQEVYYLYIYKMAKVEFKNWKHMVFGDRENICLMDRVCGILRVVNA